MATNILDGFFNLGNKATRGDPVRKAQFDYYLYWIVFLAFVGITISYVYSFFMGRGQLSTLLWACVVGVFCWFNYWGLVSFRSIYKNMKDAYSTGKITPKQTTEQVEDVKKMMSGFKNGHSKN
jgi:hypothetical protein